MLRCGISVLELKLNYSVNYGWLGGSVVERRSLTGELSLVCILSVN